MQLPCMRLARDGEGYSTDDDSVTKPGDKAQKVGGGHAATLPEGTISTLLQEQRKTGNPPLNQNIVALINKSVASGRPRHNHNNNNSNNRKKHWDQQKNKRRGRWFNDAIWPRRSQPVVKLKSSLLRPPAD
ncbi:hypothetical protein INR49_018175 [Caranx melampygus]|nr:hypothetical protein INR49_018175 [Caranx melampygus]